MRHIIMFNRPINISQAAAIAANRTQGDTLLLRVLAIVDRNTTQTSEY